MLRDSQRKKVYRAEEAVNGPKPILFESMEEMVAWVDSITASAWWGQYQIEATRPIMPTSDQFRMYGSPRARHLKITITDGRRRLSACAYSHTGKIAMPRWSRSKLIVLHEIAHCITYERPSHGRQFARNYLELVLKFLGKSVYKELMASFKKHGVKFRRERPKKVRTPEEIEAFRAKVAAWRATRIAIGGAASVKPDLPVPPPPVALPPIPTRPRVQTLPPLQVPSIARDQLLARLTRIAQALESVTTEIRSWIEKESE